MGKKPPIRKGATNFSIALPIRLNLCPIAALNRMYQMIPVGPLQHRSIQKDGSSYTYRQFQSQLKLSLDQIGMDSSLFSSHSYHRGGCTFAFLSGVPTEIIKVLGNWKSDSYLQYIHFPMEARTAALALV